MELVPADEADKKYFEELNETVYRGLIEKQLGSWNSGFEKDKFEEKWKEHNFQKILVDNQTVGGIWVQELESHYQLREIQIHPDFQNRGIGTQLIKAVIQRAKENGKELKLRVLLTNPAVNLYKRLGFTITEKNDVQYHMVFNHS